MARLRKPEVGGISWESGGNDHILRLHVFLGNITKLQAYVNLYIRSIKISLPYLRIYKKETTFAVPHMSF